MSERLKQKKRKSNSKVDKAYRKLKSSLIRQSFCPLYLLLLLKYGVIFEIVVFLRIILQVKTIDELINVVRTDLYDDEKSIIITIILMLIAIISIVRGVITFLLFEDMWISNSSDNGEKIEIQEFEHDVGVTFFVTYILPLMLDDIDTLRGFAVFFVLMLLMIALLHKSNLFYQNPVLSVMGYKVFRFKFIETTEISLKDKLFIGLTKGNEIMTRKTVKQRKIGDELFLVISKDNC